ncbi:hypothetical protein F5B17DRAFT_389965 [Nemania serpens]|nr:hypothetical protein F5B17DRAFT_389965 [Nemania serpens]
MISHSPTHPPTHSLTHLPPPTMCCDIRTVSTCPTCQTHLSECRTKQWCREALRRGTFGRCSAGLGQAEEEYRGRECRPCAEIREKAMDEMNMDDFAEKRLGWNRGRDSDDDGGYGW